MGAPASAQNLRRQNQGVQGHRRPHSASVARHSTVTSAFSFVPSVNQVLPWILELEPQVLVHVYI
jgi:hypothetical protein